MKLAFTPTNTSSNQAGSLQALDPNTESTTTVATVTDRPYLPVPRFAVPIAVVVLIILLTYASFKLFPVGHHH